MKQDYENYEVMKLQTWIDMFDPSEINLDKIQEYLDFIKEAIISRDNSRYGEWHHVMPRCVDEDHKYENEVIKLNGADHFRAHMKLVECFNRIKKRLMSCALIRIRGECRKDITPEEWEESRTLISDSNKGSNNPAKRDDVRLKMSKSLKGIRHTEEWCKEHSKRMSGTNNPMYGKHHSEETKRRLSESNKGENSPVYGKHWKLSPETRKRISESHKGIFCGEKNPFYGKKHSEKSKELMRKSHKDYSGENHPMYGKVGPLSSNYGTVWITDGHTNRRIKKDEQIPEGWYQGKTHSVKKCWITNGTDNMYIEVYIEVSKPLPDGWSHGRTYKRKSN